MVDEIMLVLALRMYVNERIVDSPSEHPRHKIFLKTLPESQSRIGSNGPGSYDTHLRQLVHNVAYEILVGTFKICRILPFACNPINKPEHLPSAHLASNKT